jgi:hypothetical protein
MPRAKRRIRRATVGQGRELIPPVEWELTVWQGLCIAGMGLDTAQEFRSAWAQYRELILPAWAAQMPGSRPFAAYVCQEIPAPPIVQSPYPSDTGRGIGGVVFYEAHAYGIGDEPELEYLLRLGLIDADEELAARQRIDKHGSACLYQWISQPAGDAHATARDFRLPGSDDSATVELRPAEG